MLMPFLWLVILSRRDLRPNKSNQIKTIYQTIKHLLVSLFSISVNVMFEGSFRHSAKKKIKIKRKEEKKMIALCIIFVKSDAYSILFGTDWRLVLFH